MFVYPSVNKRYVSFFKEEKNLKAWGTQVGSCRKAWLAILMGKCQCPVSKMKYDATNESKNPSQW